MPTLAVILLVILVGYLTPFFSELAKGVLLVAALLFLGGAHLVKIWDWPFVGILVAVFGIPIALAIAARGESTRRPK